jgi:hypothetical protein
MGEISKMANTIRIKRRASGAAGAPTGLANAELAYNEVDDTLYYGKGTGGAGGLATTAEAIAGSGAYVGLSGTQTITGNKTFSGTVSLGASATATTKSANNNSTSVATTAYVDSAVSASGSFTGLSFAGDTGTTETIANGNTLTVSGGTGLSSVVSATDTVTVNLDNTAVSAGSYGSASAIPTFTVDAQGRLTAAGTASISTSFTVDADDGDNLTISGGDTFVIVGGTGLTSVASATDTLTLNLDNTTVTAGSFGSATAVSTFTVDAQGRLTAAGTATIAIPASAVTDFNEAAQDAVGNAVGTGLTYTDSTGAISVTANTYDAYGSASTVAGNLTTHTSATEAHGATGAVVGTTNVQTLTNKTLTTPTINGPTITAVGQTPVIHGILLPATHNIIFEGTTDNDFETTLYVVDPTADRTVSLPDATGTVALTNNKLSDFAATSSSELAGIISDETGTGALVFANTPTLVTPNIGAATGTSLTLSGDLTVNGTTTTINSTTVSVDDKNLELGSSASPTDAGADGGGITLKGDTDKTFNWIDATDAWTSSENMNLVTGKSLLIAGTSVLNATTLGSGVTASSLTSVGTIATGTWNGTAIAIANGGTGSTDAGAARTALGLAIGTNVQAYNSTLAAVAGGTYTGDDSITTLGTITAGTWTGTSIAIANGGTGSANAGDARTALGLAIGTNVQAYSSTLADVAAGNYTLDGGTF